ncbi:MAG TPA: hypothetical protein EYN67_08010 [Flavobacteriales bacterium]|nr:hypothetical protein [Flavobacteriales bacterium]
MFMRFIALLLATLLTSCGGGDSGGPPDNGGDDLPFDNLNYVDSWSFPLTDNIEFDRQDFGDVIALSDKSLWYMTGDHSSGQDALGYHNVTIYDDADGFV